MPEPADELARQEPPALEERPRVDFFDERAVRRAGEGQAWGSPPPAPFVPSGAGGIPGAALPPERVDWPSRDRVVEEPPNDAMGAAAVPQRYQPATPWVPEHAYQPDDLAALAATVRFPMLVLVGSQDTPFVAASREMADVIEGAQLVIIPDAGHSPQFENPRAWIEALSRFLASVPVPTK